MDFITVTLDSLNMNIPSAARGNGGHDLSLLRANRDRVMAQISHAPGTLIMIDGERPMIVLESGWLLDGRVFDKWTTLANWLFP